MLVQTLQHVINPDTVFVTAEGVVAPYTFYNWAQDASQFRYTVHHAGGTANKRVIISELRSLLEYCLNQSVVIVNRALYKQHCPTVDRDGWCGYPIIGNVVQLLGVGQYGVSPVAIHINNRDRLATLLA